MILWTRTITQYPKFKITGKSILRKYDKWKF